MIKEAIIAMTLFGCGDTVQSCDYISTSQKTWTNKAACEAEIPHTLQTQKNASYPVLTASCQMQNAAPNPEIKQINMATKPVTSKNTFERLQIEADEVDLNVEYNLKAYVTAISDRTNVLLSKLTDFLKPSK